MRADCSGSMRMGTAQREIQARGDVPRAPMHVPIERDRVEGAEEGAVGVRPARPDLALVEMRVHVDEGGEDDPPCKVDGVDAFWSAAEGGDPPLLDKDGRRRETIHVGAPGAADEAGRNAGPCDGEA